MISEPALCQVPQGLGVYTMCVYAVYPVCGCKCVCVWGGYASLGALCSLSQKQQHLAAMTQ